jgi:hypothetical protein
MAAKITVKNNGSIRIEGEFELFDLSGKKFNLNGPMRPKQRQTFLRWFTSRMWISIGNYCARVAVDNTEILISKKICVFHALIPFSFVSLLRTETQHRRLQH